jgi:hypothetical protein
MKVPAETKVKISLFQEKRPFKKAAHLNPDLIN